MPGAYSYYYVDWTYIALLLPVMLLALYAQARVKSTFRSASQMRTQRGLTGYDAARMVLDNHGLYHVRIEHISGTLTDNYNPRKQTIFLSDDVYGAATPAAVGVAAHEAGHAVQHAEGYGPLVLRNSIIKATNIGSWLAMPMILLGLLLSGLGQYYIWIAYFGVGLYSLGAFFQLLTLPTEFNASRRAVTAIESSGMLTDVELTKTKKVLRAAALTYVAALASSLVQLLRLILIVLRSSNRRRD